MEALNEINPAYSLCFSGHRPSRLPGNGDPDASEMQPLIAALRKELIAAIDRGKTTIHRQIYHDRYRALNSTLLNHRVFVSTRQSVFEAHIGLFRSHRPVPPC